MSGRGRCWIGCTAYEGRERGGGLLLKKYLLEKRDRLRGIDRKPERKTGSEGGKKGRGAVRKQRKSGEKKKKKGEKESNWALLKGVEKASL